MFADQLIDHFDVPKETLLDIPIIKLEGNRDINVENFEGIAEYGESCIKLRTQCGLIAIEGKQLCAKSMNNEMIKIKGYIQRVTFEG